MQIYAGIHEYMGKFKEKWSIEKETTEQMMYHQLQEGTLILSEAF